MPGTLASTGAQGWGVALAAITLLGIGVPLLLWALFSDRSRGRKRCPKCWYDMAGAPSLTCPECGRTARNPRALLRAHRRWKSAALALVLIAGGVTICTGSDAAFARAHRCLPVPVLNTLLRPFEYFAAKAHTAWCAAPDPATNSTSLTRLLVAHHNNRLLLNPNLFGTPILGQGVYGLGPEARLMLPGLESALTAGADRATLDALVCLQRARIPGAADAVGRILLSLPLYERLNTFAHLPFADMSPSHRPRFFADCERNATDPMILRVVATELTNLDIADGRRQSVLDRLADNRPDVRRGVLYALAPLNDQPWAVQLIRQYTASDPAESVRATAISVLPNVESDAADLDSCFNAALDDHSTLVRLAAIRRARGEHLGVKRVPASDTREKLELLWMRLRASEHAAILDANRELRNYLNNYPVAQTAVKYEPAIDPPR